MSTFRYHKNLFPYEKTFRWLKGLLLDFDTVLMVEYVITVITYGQYGDLVYKKWIIGYLCDKNPRKTSETYYRKLFISKLQYAKKSLFFEDINSKDF